MTPLDRRFADRVRDVFDAYEEPVDEAALARLRTALAASPTTPTDRRAPDRAPIRAGAARSRRVATVAAVLLVLASGAWLWSRPTGAPADRPAVASARPPDAGPAGSQIDIGSGRTPARASEPAGTRAAPPVSSDLLAEPATTGQTETPTPRVADLRTPERPAADAEALPQPPTQPPTTGSPAPSPSGPAPTTTPDQPAPVFVASAPPVDPLAARPARDAEPAEVRRSGVRLVVATATALSGERRGSGVAAGAAREWRVGRGVSLSAGALVAYTRVASESEQGFAATDFSDIERDPTRSISVVTRSRFAALAVEVPLDIGVTLAAVPRGRVGLSVGLVPAVYAVQTLRESGQTYSGRLVANPVPGDPLLVVSALSFADRAAARPPGRFGVGLNLGLGYASQGPLGVDVTARLPLVGAAARDLPATLLGLRLRYALP